MRLPFTHEQFLAVFAAYNTAYAALIAALWVATAILLAVSFRRRLDRTLSGLLAVHWLWSGILYHWLGFARINPGARLFAVLFVLQGALFLWLGVVRRRLEFRWGARPRQVLGAALAIYGLAYPALALASGLRWPGMPAFGVPCPTTLVTLGLLLTLEPGRLRGLVVIPVLWAAIGGSAAIALGVPPDYMLPVGGALVLGYALRPRRPAREPV